MVFEKLSIDCESIENRNEVFKVLNSIGYRGLGIMTIFYLFILIGMAIIKHIMSMIMLNN